MKAHARRPGKPLGERTQTAEGAGRIALLIAPDCVGDQRVDVVRRQPQRFGEGTTRGDGPAEALQRDPVDQQATQSAVGPQRLELCRRRAAANPVREARREDRQAGRELRMDEVVGPDGVRRVRLDITRLAPGRAGVAGPAQRRASPTWSWTSALRG